MKPRQITAGELGKAYAKLKCEPSRMEWVNIEQRTCSPLVALLIASRRVPARRVLELFGNQSFEFCCKWLTFELNTHISYISGFELGFALLDRDEISEMNLPHHLIDGDEYEFGYADGRLCGKLFE